jgi:hypothetical protein
VKPTGGEDGNDPDRVSELLGTLTHEVALLLRADMELAASQRRPELNQLAADGSMALAAGVAALLGLGMLSWAAVDLLSGPMQTWAAQLIVAAGWAAAALYLLRRGQVTQLRRHWGAASLSQRAKAAERTRREMELAVRVTAEKLVSALAREALAAEVHAGLAAERQIVAAVENDAVTLVREIVTLVSAPGRAGVSMLGKLVDRP